MYTKIFTYVNLLAAFPETLCRDLFFPYLLKTLRVSQLDKHEHRDAHAQLFRGEQEGEQPAQRNRITAF